jgi:hypothetical protein
VPCIGKVIVAAEQETVALELIATELMMTFAVAVPTEQSILRTPAPVVKLAHEAVPVSSRWYRWRWRWR